MKGMAWHGTELTALYISARFVGLIILLGHPVGHMEHRHV